MKTLVRVATAVATSAMAVALAGAPASAQDYYAGKTITVVVPFSPGGATFVSAKFLEPFLRRKVEKNMDLPVLREAYTAAADAAGIPQHERPQFPEKKAAPEKAAAGATGETPGE